MTTPRKLGRRLLKRDSSADRKKFSIKSITIDGDSPRQSPDSMKIFGGMKRAPMTKNHTLDDGFGIRLFVSDNMAEQTKKVVKNLCNYGSRKFVKQKSSTDLLAHESNSQMVANSEKNQSTSLSSMFDRRKEKPKRGIKHVIELFGAIERNDLCVLKSILPRKEIDIDCLSPDNLSLLDVATLLNHNEVALILLKHGARENHTFASPSMLIKHLQVLIDSTQNRLAEPKFNYKQNLSPAKHMDKQICILESRIHLLKKMHRNLEKMTAPRPLKNVTVQVSSLSSILVLFETFTESTNNRPIATKYRVDWSRDNNFSNIEGTMLVNDLRRGDVTVKGLKPGVAYFIRAFAGNIAGFSEPIRSRPEFIMPSSWKDTIVGKNRIAQLGKLECLTELYSELIELRNSEEWGKIGTSYTCGDSSTLKKKKSGLKNLFSTGTKFHKNSKRGIYLATIFYTDDKILSTVDDVIPMIEIDDLMVDCMGHDYFWLMKLSCAWDEVNFLNCSDEDQTQKSSNAIFRAKLLDAVLKMQASLGVSDLGRLHCLPITDNKSITVLATVQRFNDPKLIQSLSLKWMAISKLYKRQASFARIDKQITANDLVMLNLLNVLNFHATTYVPLDKGLYMCYMKLHSSMNQISVVVPENLPSVLPFFYVRENSHVSKEEWDWLKILESDQADAAQPTSTQLAFHWALSSSAQILMKDMQVDENQVVNHRIFSLEVIEVHADVTFIVLLPGYADVCSVPGHQWADREEKRGCFALPVPIFETAHMCTYQPAFITVYCKISVFLDFYIILLQQLQRQTIRDCEFKSYKQLSVKLQKLQTRLENVWRPARWISSVATVAREKQSPCGLQINSLTNYAKKLEKVENSNQMLKIDNSNEPLKSPHTPPSRSSNPPSFGDSRIEHKRSTLRRSDALISSQCHRLSVSSSLDQTEDSSDVGYHSDQSTDKFRGLTPKFHLFNQRSPTVDIPAKIDHSTQSARSDFLPKFQLGPTSKSSELRRKRMLDPDYHHHNAIGVNISTLCAQSNGALSFDNPEYYPLTDSSFANGAAHTSRPASVDSQASDTSQSKSFSCTENGKSENFTSPFVAGCSFTRKSRRPRRASTVCAHNNHEIISSCNEFVNSIKISPNFNTFEHPNLIFSPVLQQRQNDHQPVVRLTSDWVNGFRRISRNDDVLTNYENLIVKHCSSSSNYKALDFKCDESFVGPTSSQSPSQSEATVRRSTPCHADLRPYTPVNSNLFRDSMIFNKPLEPPYDMELIRQAGASDLGQTISKNLASTSKIFDLGQLNFGNHTSRGKIEFSAAENENFQEKNDIGTMMLYHAPYASNSLDSDRKINTSVEIQKSTSTASLPQTQNFDGFHDCALKVYVAYPCGVPKGTSVRLRVGRQTTARQVIGILTKHLRRANSSGVLSGEHQDPSQFCLAVVIGARERCLRNDYAPMDLQNPWTKGKLFIRLKNDILAALEFGNEAKV